ncbi:MAG: acetylglutamate kinase [Alistipes sp.]|nr:acetylglutamate kinase [Alistipes sp.]
MEQITVIKIGGNVIDNAEALERFVKAFAAIEGAKILVHGGGKLATRMAERLEIPVQMIDGRRITDKATLDIVTMVYAGLVNKQLVAALQGAGCNALGLSGADGHIVRAHRRAPNPIDYGFVGDIDGVDSALLGTLLEAGITPVFSAIMYDGERSLLNCNADSVAEAIARGAATLAPTDLIFCFEKRGVLRDADNEDSVIARITPTSYPPLKADGVVKGGMIPKIENALKAVEAGVRRVCIKHADDLLIEGGTIITND